MSWSGGKDSAWALHIIRKDSRYDLKGLVTTVNSAFRRVAIHGFRTQLLELQAERLQLPLLTVPLPNPCTNEEYEAETMRIFDLAKKKGITGVAFGDLFLEDVRAYRERQLESVELEPLFPIWGLNTRNLADEMIRSGIRGRIACIDLEKLDRSFAGREFDDDLLRDLPAGTDPCGEKGEFHTFVYDGPIFTSAIPIRSGPIVVRGAFAFADLRVGRPMLVQKKPRGVSSANRKLG